MELENLVRASIFCAMAIAMGYSLMMVPNIELITVTIFLSGITLNLKWGAMVGLVAMAIYSGLNPLGSGLSFPPLFFAQIIGMSLCGIIGGILKPIFFVKKFSFLKLFLLGLAGFLVTFLYDVLTLVSYQLFSGLGFPGIIASLIKGLGFTLLHEISNIFIFLITVPRVVQFLKK
jgi:hypothetical protein